MSRFPKLTETFILYEMQAAEQQGLHVELYPLLRERCTVMHPEAKAWMERAHFEPFFSWSILRAQFRYLRTDPATYLSTVWALVRGNWGSLNFLVGGLAIFPKAVYFAEQMSAAGVQHVHAHFASHPAAAAFIIHRLAGLPYSFTAHGSDIHVDRHMLKEKVAEAAFVVAISEYNREVIAQECGAESRKKIVVIHCGVDTDVFRPREKQARDTFTILCTGTLHEVKGQRYLIDACRILRDHGTRFAAYLVGDGPDRNALAREIRDARLDGCVQLLGRRTRGQVAELLAQTDVVVTPSVPTRAGKREGIPVVLMEAMASGVPVVASGISGIPELVEHERTGLLVPPRDAVSLAGALQRLYDDPALSARLGAAGREKVIQDFDLHANAALLANRISVSALTAAAERVRVGNPATTERLHRGVPAHGRHVRKRRRVP